MGRVDLGVRTPAPYRFDRRVSSCTRVVFGFFSVFFVRAGRGLGFGRRETVARLIETGVALADACVVYVCVRP